MTKENFKSSTETFRAGKQVEWLYKIFIVILVLQIKVSRSFQSFFWFRWHQGYFLVSRGILVILEGLGGGYFGHFFRFQRHFGQFLSFKYIIDIFLDPKGILITFQVTRSFQSFFRFQGHFSHFLGSKSISFIFQVQGRFGHFLCSKDILVFFESFGGILVTCDVSTTQSEQQNRQM